jgi:hypothetical protein
MKEYRGVEVKIHTFIASALEVTVQHYAPTSLTLG